MNWQPSCPLENLRARAELYAQIRAFFSSRKVMEVETPLLSCASATDPQLESIVACLSVNPGSLPRNVYLHTSPEFPMKRLLAAGSGDIFQICKTFRNGETGQRHNPEFSMLEWYREGFSLQALMAEVEALIQAVGNVNPAVQLSYRDAFLHYLSFDPFIISDAELAQKANELSAYNGPELSRDDTLNLLLSQFIEPKLGRSEPTFLTEYPESQASLAKVKTSANGYKVAERFELYLNGLEIANGYDELTDAQEQIKRFTEDNTIRRRLGLNEMPVDENLIAAMQTGLPTCSGVALGLDRLLMVIQGAAAIGQVLAFPIDRA